MTLCSCGTPLVRPRQIVKHRLGVWHKIAREARGYRKAGRSYSWIARHVKHEITAQGISYNLKVETMYLTSTNGKRKVKP